jgi:hypothetical protein
MLEKSKILSLYRSLLKIGFGFHDYNFKNYVVRRTIQEFKRNQSLVIPEQIDALYGKGLEELKMLQRQKIVQNLYG